MVLKESKEGRLFLIQVFQKGFETSPTLKYILPAYEIADGMITVLDPKAKMNKSFPTSICTIDEVLQHA